MDGIHQFDPDFVRAGRQQGHVDRGSTHVRPQPRQVVYMYVEMSDPRRCVEGIFAGLRTDVHVLHAPRDPDDAFGRKGSLSGG